MDVGTLRVDPRRRDAYVGERRLELRPREFDLLAALARDPGVVWSRDDLLSSVWGTDFPGETRTVDVHVSELRRKLGEDGPPIETVKGVGYRLVPPAARAAGVSTLRGRIGAALLGFGLVTLLAVGGTLWVALRDLHRDAALGSLAELTVPYASQARQRFPLELLRPSVRGERAGADVLREYRESRQGRLASEAFESFVAEAQEEIEAAGISVLLISDGSTVVRDPVSGAIETLATAPQLEVPELRGTVQTGTAEVEGIGEVLYAATLIREPLLDRAVPTLVLAREDNSARLATEDLVRALTVAALFLLVIGIPLALGLSRSVTGPLHRLAAASDTVAAGRIPEPLPITGPAEVAEASAAFNAMATEVDATRQAQRQLLADVRHDLRTPLTVIAGFSQALRDGTASGEAAERAATAIADEAGRLERMLADLDHLTVAGCRGAAAARRPAGWPGHRPGHRRTVRRRSRIAWTVAGLDSRPSRRAGRSSLVGDRDVLDRILGNVVANALAHAPSPGGHIELEVRSVGVADAPIGGPGGWAGTGRSAPGRPRRRTRHPRGRPPPRLRSLLPG